MRELVGLDTGVLVTPAEKGWAGLVVVPRGRRTDRHSDRSTDCSTREVLLAHRLA